MKESSPATIIVCGQENLEAYALTVAKDMSQQLSLCVMTRLSSLQSLSDWMVVMHNEMES